MKPPIRGALAIALLLSARAAAHPITLDPAQIADGGITVAAPRPITYTPQRRGYGMVVDAGAALVVRARVIAADAQSKLAAINAKRTATLYGGAGNVSQASVQQTAATAAVAQARLAGVEATARAQYGAALGHALIDGGPALTALSRGGSLVEVSLQGDALRKPPATAAATHGIALRLIGLAGHVSAGVLGETLYYSGPNLPVGTPLAVELPTGPARPGIVVPASAVIYTLHGANLYIETAPGHFSAVTLPTANKIWRHGSLTGYFLAAGILPPGAKLVVRGAGLLRSIDKSAKKSAALPVGD